MLPAQPLLSVSNINCNLGRGNILRIVSVFGLSEMKSSYIGLLITVCFDNEVEFHLGLSKLQCIICIGMLCCLPVIHNLTSFNCSGARYANPLFLHLTRREEKRKPFGAMWVGGDCRKFYIWPSSVNISVKEPVGHACELWEKGCRSLGSCNK